MKAEPARSWTVVVAGALQAQDPSAERLADPLRAALRPFSRTGNWRPSAPGREPVHRAWLAARLGVPGEPAPTAPYAWRALAQGAAAPLPLSPGDGAWIAHCDPVRMTPAQDRFQLCLPGPGELGGDRRQAMFELAREAVRERGFELRERAGHWFLHSDRAWDFEAASIELATGRDAGALQPKGADARTWRILADDIAMRWHAQGTWPQPEDTGGPSMGSLWLHGGGAWVRALPPAPCEIRSTDAAVLGWFAAGIANEGGGRRDDARIDVIEFEPAASLQTFEPPDPALLAARVQRALREARSAGSATLDLVLCGEREARILRARPGRPRWLSALRTARPDAALLGEGPAP